MPFDSFAVKSKRKRSTIRKTRTSGAPHGGPNGMQVIEFGPLAEDLTWILSHFARGVPSSEPLENILAGPSPKLPVRN